MAMRCQVDRAHRWSAGGVLMVVGLLRKAVSVRPSVQCRGQSGCRWARQSVCQSGGPPCPLTAGCRPHVGERTGVTGPGVHAPLVPCLFPRPCRSNLSGALHVVAYVVDVGGDVSQREHRR